MAFLSYFDKNKSIASSNYNRWLFPPAALAVHMCIGQAYGLSVFNKPLSMLNGVTSSTPSDWPLTTTVWIFNIAFAMLGISAAIFGKWVEKNGPRKTMFISACFFAIGFFISAIGIKTHQIFLLYLGYGFFGGIALGLGYISPVSTLIKWFPDKPGMATGMAIMGFGSGAMIGAPLASNLMDYFGNNIQSQGIFLTFITMGILYFILMIFGSLIARVPAENWKPDNYDPSVKKINKMITSNNVNVDNAVKTKQFWLLWLVLCLNVTAGIGVLSQASPMIQEMFSEGKMGKGLGIAAAGFVGLLSLFNLIGRFVWSSISDFTGRKNIYIIYLGIGALLYSSIPSLAQTGNIILFVVVFCIILSMYGAGFSTIPAYLKDMFGTVQVGAIHGRLLTAWSTAAILGPTILTYLRESQIKAGIANGLTESIAKANAYNTTMYIMASLLVLGFICNLLIKPVNEKYHNKQ